MDRPETLKPPLGRRGADPDLQAYTRAYMAQMARDVGATLDWIAATHQETAHVHTHVMIRGRDLAERDLYLTKHYWAYGLRYRAQEMATDFLGPYSRDELFWMHRTHTEQLSQLSVWAERHASMAKHLRDTPERRQAYIHPGGAVHCCA